MDEVDEVTQTIKEKIKALLAEENTDLHKLRMFVRFLEDIKAASVTSVPEMQAMENRAVPYPPQAQRFGNPPRNELNIMMDEIREYMHDFRKRNETPAIPKIVPVGMYISWYEFLQKLGYPQGDEEIEELRNRLLDIIFKSIREEIDNMNNKNKNNTKDTPSGEDSAGAIPASTETVQITPEPAPRIEGGAPS